MTKPKGFWTTMKKYGWRGGRERERGGGSEKGNRGKAGWALGGETE
jgi:hypothetical protein